MKKNFLKKSLNIVILEDDTSFNEILNLKISSLGFKTYPFTDIKKAVNFIENNNMVFLITDYSLSGGNAEKVIKDLQSRNYNPPFIVITGEGNEEIASEIMKLGALDYIVKDGKFLSNIENKFLNAISRYQNVLEKQEWQKKIEISEQKYHKIFDNIIDVYFEINDNKTILEISPSVKNILGYDREELIGKNYNLFMHGANTLTPIKILQKNKELYNYKLTIYTKNGNKKHVELNVKKINDVYVGMMRDVSEILELEQQLSKISLETEEHSKRLFAENLHDNIGPLLSSVKIYLSLIENENKSTEKQKSLIKFTKGIIDEAITKVRNLTDELSSNIFNDFGLKKALEATIEKYKYGKIDIEFNYNIKNEIDNVLQIIVYKTIGELINNSFKHSNASEIKINIECNNNNLHIYYSDNGKGFDINKILSKKNIQGHGLIFIINRINKTGGEINFKTSLNKGVKVNIYFKDIEILKNNCN